MNNIKLRYVTYFLPLTCVGFIYLALILWVLPHDSFFSPDSGIKFFQLKEMIKQGVLNPAFEYPGRKIDKSLEFQPYSWLVSIKDNKIYSHFSPVYPWLSSFFYRKLGVTGLYIISAFAGFLCLVIMYHFSRCFVSDSIASLFSIILGLGTPIFFYSLVYWEHILAFALSLLIVVITMRILEGQKKRLIVLPPLMLLCIWIRSETAPFVIAILIAGVCLYWKSIFKHKNVLWIGLGVFLLVGGAFISFNLMTTDTFLGMHISKHLFNDRAISAIVVPDIKRAKVITTLFRRAAFSPQKLEYATTAAVMAALVISLPTIILKRFNCLKMFKHFDSRWLNTLLIISIATISAISIINLFSHNIIIGLLQVTPFVIFAVLSFLKGSEDVRLRFIQLVTIIYFTFALFMPSDGGLQWGPRYIIYIYPFIVILCWDSLTILKNQFSQNSAKVLKASCILLVLFSFVLQIKGIIKLYSLKKRNLQIEAVVAAEPTGVIVSEFEHFLAAYAPGMYDQKMFFYARNNNIGALVHKLYEQGISKFSMTAARSVIDHFRIKKSTLLSLKISDRQGGHRRIFPVIEKYRDEQQKKGLVLTVFEIR